MSPTKRGHSDSAAAETPEKTAFGEQLTKQFTTGVERIAEAEKKAVDVAMQQSVEAIDLWKKAVQKIPGTPGFFLLELAGSGFERLAETQKSLIDLVVEQSRAAAELMRERTTTAAKVTEGAVAFAREAVGRAVATEKKALEHSAAQTREVLETAKRPFGFDGGAVEAAADSIQRGVNAITDVQKDLLEMAIR